MTGESPLSEGDKRDENATNPGVSADTDAGSLRAPPMCAVYRHDVHKLLMRSHTGAAEEYQGVPVNEPFPRGADRDAALLSRPPGDPEQTVANHVSPYRLSLLTGEVATDPDRIRAAADDGYHDLIVPEDPELLHARWLTSPVPAAHNEAVSYPYTSLKYHVLLTGALLANYRAGHAFEDCWLVATMTTTESSASADETQGPAGTRRDAEAALAADAVEPHRTVLWAPPVALHITGDPGARPAASLGDQPARSFADVWSRLPAHPIETDDGRHWQLLDAQCRRIRSWSTALQYIDEYMSSISHSAGGDIA